MVFKKKRKSKNKYGHYAFAIGVLVALFLGLAGTADIGDTTQSILSLVLVLLGIAVGFMNVVGKETKDFLLSSTVLVIVSALMISVVRSIYIIGPVLADLLSAILTFTVPAVIVVALKNIWKIEKT